MRDGEKHLHRSPLFPPFPKMIPSSLRITVAARKKVFGAGRKEKQDEDEMEKEKTASYGRGETDSGIWSKGGKLDKEGEMDF